MDLHDWFLVEKGDVVCVAGLHDGAIVVTSAVREKPERTAGGIIIRTLRSTYSLRGTPEKGAYEKLVAATQ